MWANRLARRRSRRARGCSSWQVQPYLEILGIWRRWGRFPYVHIERRQGGINYRFHTQFTRKKQCNPPGKWPWPPSRVGWARWCARATNDNLGHSSRAMARQTSTFSAIPSFIAKTDLQQQLVLWKQGQISSFLPRRPSLAVKYQEWWLPLQSDRLLRRSI